MLNRFSCILRLSAFALLASLPLAAPAHAANISGVVIVPEGHDVNGAYLIFCEVLANEDCDMATALGGQFTEEKQPQIGEFDVEVPPGARGIVVWKDLNGNNEMDDGDLVGIHSNDGETYALVEAPASGLIIPAIVMGTEDSVFISPERRAQLEGASGWSDPGQAAAPQAGGGLAGDWYYGQVRRGGFFDADRGRFVTDSANDLDGIYLRLAENGTYEWSQLYRTRVSFGTACYLRLYTYHSGTYTSSAGQLTLAPRQVAGRRENSCSPSSNADYQPNIGTETYGVEFNGSGLGLTSPLGAVYGFGRGQ